MNARHRKQKRAKHRHQQGPRPRPAAPPTLEGLIWEAAEAFRDERAGFPLMMARLRDRTSEVGPRLTALLVQAVTRAWGRGWQPADVVRSVKRQLGRRHVVMAVELILEDAKTYSPETLEPRWRDQLKRLAAGRLGEVDDPIGLGVGLLSVLMGLPTIPGLGAPPGQYHGPSPGASATGVDPDMLRRIRALLAKAESTTFPEEAQAFTAKAQDLMAKYSIEHALLSSDPGSGVNGRRIGVDNPYAPPKAHLLGTLADTNRCRAVWSKNLGFSTLFGVDLDLDHVELLYTSLLVQAHTLLSPLAAGLLGASTASFRRSYFIGFALSIGERLRETAAAAVAEGTATYGDRLLPVLAQRTKAVDDTFDRAFPKLDSFGLRPTNRAGHAAGVVAGSLATLGAHPEVPAEAAP